MRRQSRVASTGRRGALRRRSPRARACPRARVDEKHVRTALAAALRRHRHRRGARALLQREDNIKALLISVVSTQATRLEHRNMRTRAFAFSLFDRLAVDRAPRSFSTALLLSLTTTLADRKPLRHLRPTITHPLVFAHSCFHPRSHSGSLALSRKEEAKMVSKLTSQGSRATHNGSC